MRFTRQERSKQLYEQCPTKWGALCCIGSVLSNTVAQTGIHQELPLAMVIRLPA